MREHLPPRGPVGSKQNLMRTKLVVDELRRQKAERISSEKDRKRNATS